jgi:hypothetical protein
MHGHIVLAEPNFLSDAFDIPSWHLINLLVMMCEGKVDGLISEQISKIEESNARHHPHPQSTIMRSTLMGRRVHAVVRRGIDNKQS